METLTAHIQSCEKGKILITGSNDALKKYLPIMESSGNEIEVCEMNGAQLTYDDAVDLVIVLGTDNRNSQDNYEKCTQYKEHGVPVVFGNSERGLTFSAPNWRTTDLTIIGMFHLASQYLMGLPKRGSYLEFGVFDGRSFTQAFHSLRKVCKYFHAYDSFSGIIGAKDEEKGPFANGTYYANVETFWHNMKVAGCDQSKITVHQGAFQDSLAHRTAIDDEINHVSLVHIDADIYEAAMLALDYVAPALQDGALIMFDEFHAFAANNNKGERKAFKDWLARNPDFEAETYRNYGAVARSYIIHKT